MFFLYNIGLSIQLYHFKENDIIELTNEKIQFEFSFQREQITTLFIPMQQIIQQPVTSAFHIGICLIKPSRIPRIPDRSGTSDE